MFGPGGINEWMIILLIVLIIFGGKKIPELMGGLGKGVKSFKKGLDEDPDKVEESADAKKIEEKEEDKKA